MLPRHCRDIYERLAAETVLTTGSMLMNYRSLVLVLILPLSAWGCSNESMQTDDARHRRLISGIEISLAQLEAVPDAFDAVGTVRPRLSSVLSSKIVGTVVSVKAQEGSSVRRGQTLIAIDDRDLRADLHAAQAGAEEAAAAIIANRATLAAAEEQKNLAALTYNRYEKLLAGEFIAVQEFDEVKAKYRVAVAEVRRVEELLRASEAKKNEMDARVAYARTLLSYSEITAPYDGLVTAKTTEVGALAAPGVPLMTVEQSGSYRLEVQVGESSVAPVKLGLTVPVTIDALDASLTGKVAEIVPAADPQSRTFTIKIAIPAHPRLRSGIYGKASFSRGDKQVLLVPIQAVVERGQLAGVFVADDGGWIHFRLVKTGKSFGRKLEILSGLNAGERVVTNGAGRLQEGSRIAVATAE
jgi:RND family efflux transporter MFP subunit